jgi:hypothetical protein
MAKTAKQKAPPPRAAPRRTLTIVAVEAKFSRTIRFTLSNGLVRDAVVTDVPGAAQPRDVLVAALQKTIAAARS